MLNKHHFLGCNKKLINCTGGALQLSQETGIICLFIRLDGTAQYAGQILAPCPVEDCQNVLISQLKALPVVFLQHLAHTLRKHLSLLIYCAFTGCRKIFTKTINRRSGPEWLYMLIITILEIFSDPTSKYVGTLKRNFKPYTLIATIGIFNLNYTKKCQGDF